MQKTVKSAEGDFIRMVKQKTRAYNQKRAVFCITVGLLFFAGVTSAQPEANHWFFNRQRITFDQSHDIYFRNVIPLATASDSLEIVISSSSISDRFGNLLFFGGSRGLMKDTARFYHNGLGLSGRNGLQSSLALQLPGSNHIYLYFTSQRNFTGFGNQHNKAFQHKIDINANYGQGSVVQKNIPLFPYPTSEYMNVTAARHANGRDFWVIFYNNNPLSFYTFLLTDSGLSQTPIVSPAYSEMKYGSIKVSNDGRFLAVSNKTWYDRHIWQIPDSAMLELYDFNNSSGTINNWRLLDSTRTTSIGSIIGSWFRSFSGVEFSGDSKFIYYSHNQSLIQLPNSTGSISILDSTNIINQINIDSVLSGSINYKKVIDSLHMSELPLSFQIANTGSILISMSALPNGPYWSQSLGASFQIARINHPDSQGVACDFQYNAVVANNGNLPMGTSFFPNFFPAYYGNTTWIEAPIRQICLGDSVTLIARNSSSYVWSSSPNYQDTLSTDSLIRVAPIVKTTYVVRGANGTAYSVTIDVVDPAMVLLPSDTFYCKGGSVALSAPHPLVRRWQWSTGDTTTSIVCTDSGWVWVDWFTESCQGRDSMFVLRQPLPEARLGADTSLCDQISWTLDAGWHGGRWQWNPGGDTVQQKTISLPGVYSVLLQDSLGCEGRDTIRIIEGELTVSLGSDTVICRGDSLLHLANPSGKSYLWSTGSTADRVWYSGPGILRLQSSDAFCQGGGRRQVSQYPIPEIGIEADTGYDCRSNRIGVRSLYGSVSWSTGDSGMSIQVSPPAWVKAWVEGVCERVVDSLWIKGPADPVFPNVITVNGDGLNETLDFGLPTDTESYALEIMNRWGQQVWASTDPGLLWQAEGATAGVYYYRLRYTDCLGKAQQHTGWVQVMR
jgi:hypothetical protein